MTRILCNISLWQVEHIWNQSTTNFDRISISIEKALVGLVPVFSAVKEIYLYASYLTIFTWISFSFTKLFLILLPMMIAGVIHWPKYLSSSMRRPHMTY